MCFTATVISQSRSIPHMLCTFGKTFEALCLQVLHYNNVMYYADGEGGFFIWKLVGCRLQRLVCVETWRWHGSQMQSTWERLRELCCWMRGWGWWTQTHCHPVQVCIFIWYYVGLQYMLAAVSRSGIPVATDHINPWRWVWWVMRATVARQARS